MQRETCPGEGPRHALMEEKMKHALLIAGAVALATGGAATAQSLKPLRADAATPPSGSTVVAQLAAPVPAPPAPPVTSPMPLPPPPPVTPVRPPPPPPRAEAPPPPPPVAPGATAYAWQPGHWAWTGERYLWVEGRYAEKPTITAHWVPGSWRRRDNGNFAWVDGHWTYGTEGHGR